MGTSGGYRRNLTGRRRQGWQQMRIVLEADKCIGSGNCEMLAPDVFEVRDDMVCHILADEPAPELTEDAELAVEACPTRALRIE